MIRRLAPRRLGTDEEATVVEHLTELRHRLLIVVFAIIPAFAVTAIVFAAMIGLSLNHARRWRQRYEELTPKDGAGK